MYFVSGECRATQIRATFTSILLSKISWRSVAAVMKIPNYIWLEANAKKVLKTELYLRAGERIRRNTDVEFLSVLFSIPSPLMLQANGNLLLIGFSIVQIWCVIMLTLILVCVIWECGIIELSVTNVCLWKSAGFPNIFTQNNQFIYTHAYSNE